jgi:Lrp/AsnC family leucine-responsive transcriptional regulator
MFAVYFLEKHGGKLVDLDLKDRKILYQLDLNCRQSNTQIGKKVGLSRKVVEYRIKRMEEEGIITGYWTRIDSYRFGYQVYRYYIIFQNATTAIKEEIIKNIADYKNTWVVVSVTGVYDISSVIWVKSIPQFYKFWNKLNEKYGDYFAEKIFSVYLGSDCYPHSYLIKGENYKKDRENPQYVGRSEHIEITYQDYLLLESIATNARISTIQIAEELKCSSQSVSYNMNKLKENGIIRGYHTNINTSKLGLHNFKVDIWLKEVSKRKKILDILKYNPYVNFINISAGYADLEMEVVIEDTDTLVNFIEEVSSQFPGAFRKYIYFRDKKFYKIKSLPELTEKDFKK